MAVRTNSTAAGVSRFFFSYDRGHSWRGPFRLPDFGAPGTAARTDYLVNGKEDCTIFLRRLGPGNRPLPSHSEPGWWDVG